MDTKGFLLSPTGWVELPANPFCSWELRPNHCLSSSGNKGFSEQESHMLRNLQRQIKLRRTLGCRAVVDSSGPWG